MNERVSWPKRMPESWALSKSYILVKSLRMLDSSERLSSIPSWKWQAKSRPAWMRWETGAWPERYSFKRVKKEVPAEAWRFWELIEKIAKLSMNFDLTVFVYCSVD